jgi:hypothetical protein
VDAGSWVPGAPVRPRAEPAPRDPRTLDRVVLSEFRGLAGYAAVSAGMGCAMLVLTGLSAGQGPPAADLDVAVAFGLLLVGGLFPFLVAGNIMRRHFLVALASEPSNRMQVVSVALMLLLMGGAVATLFGPEPFMCTLWALGAPGAVLAAIAWPYSGPRGRWPARFFWTSVAGALLPGAFILVASAGGYLALGATLAFVAVSGNALLAFVPVIVVYVLQAPLFASMRLAPLRLRSELGRRASGGLE